MAEAEKCTPPTPFRVDQNHEKTSKTNTGLISNTTGHVQSTFNRRKDVKHSVIISACLPKCKEGASVNNYDYKGHKEHTKHSDCKPFQMSSNNTIMVANHLETKSGYGKCIKGLCPSAGLFKFSFLLHLMF